MSYQNQCCNTQIELTPYGRGDLKVYWLIGKDEYVFWPSSAVGGQFGDFIHALYALYAEGIDNHGNHWKPGEVKAEVSFPKDDVSLHEDEVRIRTEFSWFGRGPSYSIAFDRKCRKWIDPVLSGEDPILVSVTFSRKTSSYVVDGRKLCYAAAKAYTRALKKLGFYGYYWSTCANEDGDVIPMHEFLFLKAYALGRLDVRELTTVWTGENSWQSAEGTPFEKELELLLIDMD